MVCYLPGTGTLAVVGFAVYLIWHRAIMHLLGLVGTATEIALLLGAAAAVAIVLIWTARTIRRRRAQAGACTTCRFRCQQALQARPNLLVNRVDRRALPAPARPVTRTCHPAAPLLGVLRPSARPAFISGRSATPVPVPSAPSRAAPASRPVPASRPAPASRPVVPTGERWPFAPRHTVREPAPPPAAPVETVAFDGYVLTLDGVDGQPAPAVEH